MSSADIVLTHATQRILVDAPTRSASLIQAGPIGPKGDTGDITAPTGVAEISGITYPRLIFEHLAGGNSGVTWKTSDGTIRYGMVLDENGHLVFLRYDASGAYLNNMMTIRADGIIDLDNADWITLPKLSNSPEIEMNFPAINWRHSGGAVDNKRFQLYVGSGGLVLRNLEDGGLQKNAITLMANNGNMDLREITALNGPPAVTIGDGEDYPSLSIRGALGSLVDFFVNGFRRNRFIVEGAGGAFFRLKSYDSSGVANPTPFTINNDTNGISMEQASSVRAPDPTIAADVATKAYVDSRIWQGTQAEYDALGSIDPNVLYVITG